MKINIFQIENSGNEICEKLLLKYVELIQNESKVVGPFYKHYLLNENVCTELTKSVITIQESTSIVAQGTTGLCTWQVN